MHMTNVSKLAQMVIICIHVSSGELTHYHKLVCLISINTPTAGLGRWPVDGSCLMGTLGCGSSPSFKIYDKDPISFFLALRNVSANPNGTSGFHCQICEFHYQVTLSFDSVHHVLLPCRQAVFRLPTFVFQGPSFRAMQPSHCAMGRSCFISTLYWTGVASGALQNPHGTIGIAAGKPMDPSFHTNHPFSPTIPSCKPSLHTNHPFTQTILSHKPSFHINKILCNTENDIWFVWRDGLCEGLDCVPENYKWFVWRDGLCEWMVCVKGWIVSGFCEVTQSKQYVIQRGINGLFEGMVSVHTNHLSFSVLHPLTQTIYHSLYYVHSHKPFITQTIPSHKPYIILCIAYYLACVKG